MLGAYFAAPLLESPLARLVYAARPATAQVVAVGNRYHELLYPGTGGVGHGGGSSCRLRAADQPARDRDAGGGGVTPSAVSKRICCSGRGRAPCHTRAAVAVSGWPVMLTWTMSPVPAGRGKRITAGGGPAMAAGPVKTAAGRPAVEAKASITGSECRSGGSVNWNRGS